MKANGFRTIVIRGVLLILLSLYFLVVFAQKSPNLVSFDASHKAQFVSIQWVLSPSNNLSTVIVEKKLSGNSFEPIAQFWVNFDGNTERDFHFTDKKAKAKNSQYRLKLITEKGDVQYSDIVTSKSKSPGQSFRLNEGAGRKGIENVVISLQRPQTNHDLKSLLILRLQEREENYL